MNCFYRLWELGQEEKDEGANAGPWKYLEAVAYFGWSITSNTPVMVYYTNWALYYLKIQ